MIGCDYLEIRIIRSKLSYFFLCSFINEQISNGSDCVTFKMYATISDSGSPIKSGMTASYLSLVPLLVTIPP